MKFLSIVPLFILSISCTTKEKTDKLNLVPLVSIDSILSSEHNFAKYFFLDVNLDDPYKAFDEDNQSLSRHDFLGSVESGNYVPIIVKNPFESIISFQLLKLDSLQKQKFGKFLQGKGNQYASFERLLNKELPNFNFTDLKDKKYNSNTIKGKIVVVKYWFISCKPCIEEMPALNKLVKQYEDRKDVIFLSFALDKAEPLMSFLNSTQFDYNIIPDSKNYTMDTLNINVFPTHMILNKDGLVIAVSANAKTLKKQLEKFVKLE
jgi:thiol-disulfide isomerase/thioredoxin